MPQSPFYLTLPSEADIISKFCQMQSDKVRCSVIPIVYYVFFYLSHTLYLTNDTEGIKALWGDRKETKKSEAKCLRRKIYMYIDICIIFHAHKGQSWKRSFSQGKKWQHLPSYENASFLQGFPEHSCEHQHQVPDSPASG